MSNNELRPKWHKMIYGEGEIRDTFLAGTAEFIGTAMLVLMGCGGCVEFMGNSSSHLQKTLMFGFTVMIVIQCFGHISHAHINPAITVGSVVLGKKSLAEAMIYLIAQNLGAILGFGLLKASIPPGTVDSNFCVTVLNVSPTQGFMIEGMATMVLMTVACAVWDHRNQNNTDSTPMKFGLAVTCLATIFGPFTGCSMNPARSFGPAIWNNNWSQHWVYWFGPVTGALLGALFYRFIFGSKMPENKRNDIAEAVPLNYIGGEKSEWTRPNSPGSGI